MTRQNIEVYTQGLPVDYYSESFRCWAPARIETVTEENGEVVINTRILPLTSQQARKMLRPRARPGPKELAWIGDVLRKGHVESEARKLFERHARPHGRAAVLARRAVHAVGAEVAGLLGVSGCTYELLWRAAKDVEGSQAALPPGWKVHRSASTGRFYYYCGQKVQWQRPTRSCELGADAFVAVFWEMLYAVQQKWGQVFVRMDRVLRTKDEMEKDYDFGQTWTKLGSGTFGSVYLSKHRRSGIKRAVKAVHRSEMGRACLDKLDNEIGRLRMLDHPHIVKLYDCYQSERNIYIVMDFCSGGDLCGYVRKVRKAGRRIVEAVVVSLMRQVLRAVAHIHARGLLHLDIKPANTVLMPEMRTMAPGLGPDPVTVPGAWLDPTKPIHVMLIDLGLSRIFRPGDFQSSSIAGTPATMAPEAWKGVETPAADIFSVGATLFYLLADCYPFQSIPTRAIEALAFWNRKPRHGAYVAGDFYSKPVYALCDRMLLLERLSRPTAAQCLQDRLFLGTGERMGPRVRDRLQRLAKAPTRSALHSSVALTVAASWPAHRLPTIRRAFEEIDVAGTGRLHKAQIAQALVGVGIEQELSSKAADAMDLSRDGMVDWTEFVAAIMALDSEDLDDDLLELFEGADADNDGFLETKDLAKLLNMENGRDEAAAKTMQELVGNKRPNARVDWHTFRRHFCSIAVDQGQAHLPGHATR